MFIILWPDEDHFVLELDLRPLHKSKRCQTEHTWILQPSTLKRKILLTKMVCDSISVKEHVETNHAMAEETEIVQGKFIFFYRRVVHIHDMHAACFPSV